VATNDRFIKATTKMMQGFTHALPKSLRRRVHELISSAFHKPPLMFAQAPRAIGKLAALQSHVEAGSGDTRKVAAACAEEPGWPLPDDGEIAFSIAVHAAKDFGIEDARLAVWS
jgi:hypothetical protein